MERRSSRCKVAGTDATDQEYLLNVGPDQSRVLEILLVPNVSVAVHASNYITIDVKKGSTVIATHTTNSSGGAALTQGTIVSLSITGTGTDRELADNGVFGVAVSKAGVGPAYDVDVVAVMEGTRQ